ncbi:MAG: hypothetical protein JXR88_03855 [Clostridia bacterium]|nr:hypothetical protein [Clostridia bacterium]
MFETYDFEIQWTINELLKHYDPIHVEEACKSCGNYNKVWSCPPLQLDVKDWIESFSKIIIRIHKIQFLQPNLHKDEMLKVFESERQAFGQFLMSEELSGDQCLIAGHCFQCEFCTKEKNLPCVKKDKMRYSLEALGFEVGSIAKACGVPIKWHFEGENPYYLTVGGLLKK